MCLFGAAQGGWGGREGVGVKKTPYQNLSNLSYNDETWHSYTLPKENP